MKSNLFYLSVALIISSMVASCNSDDGYIYEEGVVWNTVFHITYQSDSSLSDSILNVFNEIDNSLSPFNNESLISKINDNRTNTIDTHFRNVFNESLKINQISNRAFDPTLAPLIRAWGFGQGHEVTSDTLCLDSLLNLVGIYKCDIQEEKLIKADPNIEFNFSALAKGYGVDCIADMFERNGISNYLIEVGGEIRANGCNSSGNKWSVGINRPESDADVNETVTKIYMHSGSVATSGNYRNFHDEGNKRFGHTISPATGRPVQTDVISATVIAPSCMEADALATACMVIGSSEAIKLCDNLKAGVFLIKADMTTVENADFKKFTISD